MTQRLQGLSALPVLDGAGSSPVSPKPGAVPICRDNVPESAPQPNEWADKKGDSRDSAEVERFWSYVDKTGECWVWTGGRRGKGYGAFNVRKDAKSFRMVNAHRYSYEVSVGPIPVGLVIDHLCGNRLCVNPAHLEAITNQQNITRDAGRRPKLTDRQRTYLVALSQREWVHPDNFRPIHYANATSALKGLERRGFAERVPGAYAALYRITPAGRAVLDMTEEVEAA